MPVESFNYTISTKPEFNKLTNSYKKLIESNYQCCRIPQLPKELNDIWMFKSID